MSRSWPIPTLAHLCRLTDDCGVIQHAKFWLPHYATGYCVDDNSRALLAADLHYRQTGDPAAHALLVRYLAFIFYVQREDGKVRNFLDYSRAYLESEGSPDSLGRTVWALGRMATAPEAYLAVPAHEMFHRAIVHLTPQSAPHALAYGLLGLCELGAPGGASRAEARGFARPLADALAARYRASRADDWHWFLPAMTYGNARLAEGLLRAADLLEDGDLRGPALESLAFHNRVVFREGFLAPVGCQGWYPRGGDCAMFDQQAIDAGAAVEANLAAYNLTGDADYRAYAVQAMGWFHGENVLGSPMLDPHSGGCYDGLGRLGPNVNQGAESTLAYLMAALRLREVAPEVFGEG